MAISFGSHRTAVQRVCPERIVRGLECSRMAALGFCVVGKVFWQALFGAGERVQGLVELLALESDSASCQGPVPQKWPSRVSRCESGRSEGPCENAVVWNGWSAAQDSIVYMGRFSVCREYILYFSIFQSSEKGGKCCSRSSYWLFLWVFISFLIEHLLNCILFKDMLEYVTDKIPKYSTCVGIVNLVNNSDVLLLVC